MFEDLKSLSGEKWFWPVIIGGGALFVLALVTSGSKNSDEVLLNPTDYTSYPDAVTNANAIIDSVNQFTEYTGDRIIASTSGYMEEGLDRIWSGMSDELGNIDSSIASLSGKVDSVASSVGSIRVNTSTVGGSTATVSGSNTGGSSSSSKKTTTTTTTTTKPATTTTTTTSKPATTTTTTKAAAPATYAKTNYTGVSLVDGLKSVGVYSIGGKDVGSWQSRVELAKANGISNYTGTAAQNTQLLNSLKAGTLKKV